MKDALLVDGYNVINAWPDFVDLMDNLEHARDKLADILAGYGAYKDYKVVLVFDAHLVPGGDGHIERISDMEIVFTHEGETADSYIERLAYVLVRQGWRVFVVTSDWAEQMVVLGAGACRISSRELRMDVQEANKAMREQFAAAGRQRRHEIESRLSTDIAERLDRLRRER